MSIFRTIEAHCPACGTPVDFEVVYSVAADRRPDLREAILDGSFQRQPCTSCGKPFRAEPEFSYMDIANGLYIGVWPIEKRAQWQECAARTQAVFDEMLGSGATPDAQELGRKLQPRAVFGWAALLEKIRARMAGIDDRTLEIAKAAVLRASDAMPIPGEQEFRLLRMEGDDLVCAWVRTSDGTAQDARRIPRKLIADIDADAAKWNALRESVGEGIVVDFQRDMLAA